MRRSLAAAGPVPLVGVKFAVRPHDLPPSMRADAIAAAFDRVATVAPGRDVTGPPAYLPA